MTKLNAGIIAALVFSIAAPSAHAAQNACGASKAGAASKAAKSYIDCARKELADPAFDQAACVAKAQGKLGTGFAKAETAGSCSGSTAGCGYISDLCAAAVAAAAAPNSTCRDALIKAAAKYAKSYLKCSGDYYKGDLLADVNACRNAAAVKLGTAFTKAEEKYGSCAPVSAAVIADAVEDVCGAGVVGSLADTPRFCSLCCETAYLGTTLGCSEGDADLVAAGCQQAATELTSPPGYTFTLGSFTETFCDHDTAYGGCSATEVVTVAPFCCQISLDTGPACSAGEFTTEGQTACVTDFGGTPEFNQNCINGQSCTP